MTKQKIRDILIQIFKEETKLEEGAFLNRQELEDFVDSLTLLEIVFKIENKFNIEVDDEKIPEMKDFEDVVTGVEQLLNKTSA
jgi:acyl carrier protein